MENEIFIILFDPVVVLLREPILITRSVEQMLYLRIQLSIIDFDKLDGIGMETKEAAVACRVVKNLLIVARSGKGGGVWEVLRTACVRETYTDYFAGHHILECIQIAPAHSLEFVKVDKH